VIKDNAVLVLLVIILIAINVGWFVYFRRIRPPRNASPPSPRTAPPPAVAGGQATTPQVRIAALICVAASQLQHILIQARTNLNGLPLAIGYTPLLAVLVMHGLIP
jgi:hypothetical protein